MATQKLQEQELQTLVDFQTEENGIIVDLGKIEYQISILESQKDNLLEARENFADRKQKFGKVLQEKYGNGNINIETGEITTVD